MTNAKCPTCLGIRKGLRNHPERAWSEELGCQCGAGMPCECVSVDGLEEPGCGGLSQRLGRIQGLSTQYALFVCRQDNRHCT